MKATDFVRVVSATVVCLGLVFSVDMLCGAEPADVSRASGEAKAPTVIDVKLGPGGVLRGRVVDTQGTGDARVEVLVRQATGGSVKTETDQHGDFSVRGLRGGMYQVVVGPTGRTVRAWAPNTAPPVARDALLVVIPKNVVLGQRYAGPIGRFFENAKYSLTNPLVVGTIVGLAVAIPVIVNNRDKDSGS